jgi:hypothetical protein
MTTPNTTSERQIQHEILSTLGSRPDLAMIWRNNTGKARSLHDPNVVVSFGVPGSPDIIGFLRNGRFLGIEVKAARGNQSEQQRRFQARCEQMGGLYVLARSVDDAMTAVSKALEVA